MELTLMPANLSIKWKEKEPNLLIKTEGRMSGRKKDKNGNTSIVSFVVQTDPHVWELEAWAPEALSLEEMFASFLPSITNELRQEVIP